MLGIEEYHDKMLEVIKAIVEHDVEKFLELHMLYTTGSVDSVDSMLDNEVIMGDILAMMIDLAADFNKEGSPEQAEVLAFISDLVSGNLHVSKITAEYDPDIFESPAEWLIQSAIADFEEYLDNLDSFE